MVGLKILKALVTGNAVIITKKDESKADVTIGKCLSKQFVINSMIGTVKSLML